MIKDRIFFFVTWNSDWR